MNRRTFLHASGALYAGFALTKGVPVLAQTLLASEWRTFEVVTKVELLKPSGISHIWLPAALIRDTSYQRTLSNRFTAEGGTVRLTEDKQSALGIVSAMYASNVRPVLTLTSRVSLRDYSVDLSSPGTTPPVHERNWTASFNLLNTCRLTAS